MGVQPASDRGYPEYSELTFRAEGGHLPIVLKVHWPGRVSGVTIGPGYDLGGRTEESARRDLVAAGVPEEVAAKIAKGAGRTGSKADE